MTTTTKERPILFSGPMVRAILDGRKTQTRRIVKDRYEFMVEDDGAGGPLWPYYPCYVTSEPHPVRLKCPYGKPGTRLWVRETTARAECENGDELIVYKADGAIFDVYQLGNGPKSLNGQRGERFQVVTTWTPSIHMPRWASRLTLEITGVRVERLQDISEADAEAEGFHREGCGGEGNVRTFARLWAKINGPESWDANPWVWVVTFKAVKE